MGWFLSLLMRYPVLMHAAVQFGAGVGIDFANPAKRLRVGPRGERLNIHLRAIDEL